MKASLEGEEESCSEEGEEERWLHEGGENLNLNLNVMRLGERAGKG